MLVKLLQDFPKEKITAGEKTFKQVLIGPEIGPNFAMRRFIIEPGGFMPNHTNTVEHEQLVLRGQAEIGIGGKRFNVKKIRSCLFPKAFRIGTKIRATNPLSFCAWFPTGKTASKFLGIELN